MNVSLRYLDDFILYRIQRKSIVISMNCVKNILLFTFRCKKYDVVLFVMKIDTIFLSIILIAVRIHSLKSYLGETN